MGHLPAELFFESLLSFFWQAANVTDLYLIAVFIKRSFRVSY